MSDLRDVQGARADADSATASLKTYIGQVEDGERSADVALAVGLAALATCARLEALEVRLDYLVGIALKQTSFG